LVAVGGAAIKKKANPTGGMAFIVLDAITLMTAGLTTAKTDKLFTF
jgi:hypothetical protein